MSSRKNLKKAVNYITSELFAECGALCNLIPNTDVNKLEEIIGDIIELRKEHIARISHTEPGNTKGFYKKLNEDFAKGVNDIVERLQQLGKQNG